MTRPVAPAAAGLSHVKAALLARRLRERSGLAHVPRRPERSPAPLTFSQERLWVLEALRPRSAAYHIPVACRIDGPFDAAALARAVQAVVDRHEALRTTFEEAAGEARQVVHPALAVPLRMVDLGETAGSPAERAAEGRRLLTSEAAAPFDVRGGPLVRALLVRLGEADALLLVVVHHIVFDGASAGVFLRDLGRAYAAETQAGLSLEPPALQFGDAAAWLRGSVTGERLERGRSYWARCLADAPRSLDLPADRPLSPSNDERGGRRRIVYPVALLRDLERVARAHDATPFMLFVAAFATFLFRHGAGDDIVIGAPVAGRPRPEFADLIGSFAHALALRVSLGERPSFAELLARVRETCLGAYEHQDVAYEPPAGGDGAPRGAAPFSVMLLLGQDDVPGVALGAATLAPLALDAEAAPFELVLSLAERADGFHASLQYRTARWQAASIDGLLARFGVLLRAIADRPDAGIVQLKLTTDAERALLVEASRGPAATGPRATTLDALVDEAAARFPQRPAVCDARTSLGYGELVDRAEALAARLRRAGAGRGTVVGVHAERSPGVVVALLAVLKTGAAYLPLDPKLPPARLRFMVRDAACMLVLADPARAALDLGAPALVFAPSGEPLDGDPASLAETGNPASTRPVAAASDPAYVVYTSGSSGEPKGVRVPHGAVCNYLVWMRRAFALGPADRVLQRTAFGFDAAVWVFFAPLVSGAAVVLAPPGGDADPFAVAALIREAAVTVLESSPSFLAMLHGVPELERCTSLRQVICGGELLPAALCAALRARLPVELANLYGPTEACIAATFHRYSPDDAGAAVPIGRPIDNVAAYVLDEALVPCPAGVPGELYLGGAGLALGYVERPELTAAAFVPDPFGEPGARLYRTGDRGRRLPSGELEYLGRLDRQLKLRGFRIEPGEIEAALRRLPGVRGAAVAAVPDAAGEPRLVAYLQDDGGVPRAAREWRAALAEHLPGYMLPGAFVRLAAFPLTPSGKLDRAALPALAEAPPPAAAPPRTVVEAALAPVVAEVLGLPNVGPDDDFFALGGHSLHALRAAARIAKLFRTDVSLRLFFEGPTVRELAQRLELAEAKPGEAAAIARALVALRSMSPEERARRREAAVGRAATSAPAGARGDAS